MLAVEPLVVAKSQDFVHLLPQYGNRHGLIAGATGTGKTVTLQRLAERFSSIGVPVLMADVKGDLSGLCQAGIGNKPVFQERATQMGLTYAPQAFPVTFWDVFAQQGHPIRATISEMGPVLLARLLDLNDTQEGVLNIAFRVADDHHLLLLDLKDLRAMLAFVSEQAKELTATYGNVSSASVGAIQRALLTLEEQGGTSFFGEPALDLADLMRTGLDGKGMINILAADQLMHRPRLYATFLLWLLSELFEELPEVGDLEKPRLVFFFDEAHLLFNDAPKALLEKVEQVVRLIRSKGVGVYFVTQNPIDIPDTVLGQLGNRVQHALRAFSPREQKAVKSAASTFRPNPEVDVESAITELAVGEALVSMLEAKGTPMMVQRALVCPPEARVGVADAALKAQLIQQSPMQAKYATALDRESAYEVLSRQVQQRAEQEAAAKEAEAQAKAAAAEAKLEEKRQREWEREQARRERAERPRARQSDTVLEAMAKSTMRSAGNQIGRQLVRGILGSLLRGF